MKYTLNVYGWEGEFVGKSLSLDQTNIIDDLKEKTGSDDYSEIRFDIDTHIDCFDMYDGDLLHMSKPLSNGTTHFELLNENDEIVLTFDIDDISSTDEDNEYEITTTPTKNVYFSVDESKGGIHTYEIESDDIPKVSSFKYTEGIIYLPNDQHWVVIDVIHYKGKNLEPVDHLDNYGKSSTLQIFKHNES